jgi:hypothetical protein
MMLDAGSRLGAYEIVTPLGAGGPAFARAVMLRELRRGLVRLCSRVSRASYGETTPKLQCRVTERRWAVAKEART